MTQYDVYVVRNCSGNSEIDNKFWGDNEGKFIEFETQPRVGQQIEITGTNYQNYVPVRISDYFTPNKLFVEAKSA